MVETKLLVGGRRQSVVVEQHRDGNEWMVMFPSGRVELFDTASAALTAVKAAARRGNKTITITTIEWRNVPTGWVPPD